MMKRRFTENQIISILKDDRLWHTKSTKKYGLGNSTIYHQRAKYGGMAVSDLKALKRMKAKNRRFKNLYAKISLEHTILQKAA